MTDRKNGSQLENNSSPAANGSLTFSRPRGRVYQITVQGQLRSDWSEWLDGLQVTPLNGGETVLYGVIVDQAALIGILNKLNRLNVTLLSLSQVEITEQS